MRKKTSLIWQIETSDLKKLIEKSKTMAQVLGHFGLKNKGGNHRTLKKRLEEEGIDYSKFRSNFGVGRVAPVLPLEQVLVENSTYTNRNFLKKRLIKEGVLRNECACCGMKAEWNGKPLVLILDHANGLPNDNRVQNLRLLCPNCNSQTDTFAGRNRKV